jgi:hypothetical protein
MTVKRKTNGKPSGTKSKHGTKPTETGKRYKLLGIINECQKLGVSRIKTAEFEVEFFLERSQEVGNFVNYNEIKSPTSIDKDLMDDVRLSQLMIDDPFGYEREVLNAEQRRSFHEAHEN